MSGFGVRFLFFGCAISGLLWFSPTFGEQRPDYKVELILFTQLAQPGSRAELWDRRLIRPDVGNAVDLTYGSRGDGFVTLAANARDLADVNSRLSASPRYRVIKHLVWRQPGLGKASAKSVRIQGGTDYSMQFPDRLRSGDAAYSEEYVGESIAAGNLLELDGTVKIVLGRYLHVYTDLVFRQPVTTTSAEEDGNSENFTSLIDIRIQNRRRMRSRELHYIDHPKLGMLIQITPLE